MKKQMLMSLLVFNLLALARPGLADDAQNKVGQMFDWLGVNAGLAGRGHESAMSFLRDRIQRDFGYDIRCDQSLLGGISDWDCSQALQRFIGFLHDKEINPNPEILGVAQLTVAKDGKVTSETDWGPLNMSIPYDAPADSIKVFLQSNLFSVKRVAQRRLLANLNSSLQKVGDDLKIEIQLDTKLNMTPAQIQRGLELLQQTASRLNLKPEQVLIEVLQLSDANRPVYEDRRMIKVDLNINGSLGSATTFLRQQLVDVNPESRMFIDQDDGRLVKWITIQDFRMQREQLDRHIEEIKNQLGDIGILCGHDNGMPVRPCLQGVMAVNQALKIPHGPLNALDQIIITEDKEISESQGENNRLNLLVGAGSKTDAIAHYLNTHKEFTRVNF